VLKWCCISRYIRFFLIISACQTATTAVEASYKLRLVTETTRPLNQKGLPYIKCALAKSGYSSEIKSMPWARAQLVTERGLYDGFFVASKNDKRDQYAVMSEPFFNIDWLFIVNRESGLSPDNPKFLKGIFAANRGTARNAWLKNQYDNGIISHEVVTTTDAMRALMMLALGRVDIVLENSTNLDAVFQQTSYTSSDFQSFVAKSVPMGVYFNKDFLNRHPDFLNKFNAGIKECKK